MTRPSSKALVVQDESVLVHGYDQLPQHVRDEIHRVLGEVDVAPRFGHGGATLVAPRSLAPLLGRAIRPLGRKQGVLERIRADAGLRPCPEALDAGEVVRRGHAFADAIEQRREALARVLTTYETHQVARDELARTVDLLRNLDENRRWFRRRIGEVATFLPSNQPLYALACFGLVPALMARRVHVRPPRAMSRCFDAMIAALDVAGHFPGVEVTHQDRGAFLAARGALGADGLPVTDAVIFTGTPRHAMQARRHFDDRVLFIVNGAGHNPLVVTERANLERAVAAAIRVQLYNQGQDCASPSAILVHAAVHDAFAARLREEVARVRVGRYDDPAVVVGPLSRPEQLRRIQALLADNARWLDASTAGVVRTRDAIVEPTIVLRPLAEGGNFTEQFAPIFFVQRYEDDDALAGYFEDARYPLHAMYVTVFGDSRYVDGLTERPIGGHVLHAGSTILRDTDLHAPGVERGTRPYGGHGRGASYVHRAGVTTPGPTLPPRDLFEHLVRPLLDEPEVAGDEAAPSLGDERFLDPAIAPLYRGDTRVDALVDGLDYFAAAAAAIGRTGAPGDAIFLQGYQLDPGWRVPGDPSGLTIGALLSDRAARGVDVRVLLNTTAVPVNPWRENEAALRHLGGLPGMAGRALADGAGASFIGTQHQKVLVVRAGGELTGFATGMDFVPDHFDTSPHGAKRWPDGSAWGWHDAAVRLTGPAVRGLWDNFAAQWARVAPSTWPVPPVPPCPPAAAVPSPHVVQVLRSSYGRGAPPVHELNAAMKRAIRLAERYIYVEDQFLCDHLIEHLGLPLPPAPIAIPGGFSLFDEVADRMRARPGLKAIFVGSGKSDPIDFLPGPRNRSLTPSVRRLLERLPPARRHDVGVWRIDDVTVHSKVVLIDDAFAAIGSGNFRSRSTYGIDTELQVAYVAGDGAIRRLRTALWAELLGLEPIEQPLLDDLDRALAHLHPGWGEAPPLPSARRRVLTRVRS